MPEVITATKKGTSAPGGNIVEMNWDPITRIVGSLGIFTKINFDTKKVVECYSTSSIFRGYSIFMLNKDPRDAHFITSRICGICGDAKDRSASRERSRLSNDCRYHARFESVRGRILSRNAPGKSLHAGDVLPDGRPACSSIDTLSRRSRYCAFNSSFYRLSRQVNALCGVHETLPAAT
jgi:hypothetical protein